MPVRKKILYNLLAVSCLAGYVWLFINYCTNGLEQKFVDVCFIKHVTGMPCPSCGSTRSVLAILEGDFFGSLLLNPIGVLLFLILAITPFWLLFDFVSKKENPSAKCFANQEPMDKIMQEWIRM